MRAAAAPLPRTRRVSPVVLAATVAIAACAVVAGLLIVSFAGKSDSGSQTTPTIGSLKNALPGAAEVNALFKNIPQHGATLGRANAPVTVEEYVDVQCPYCGLAEIEVLPDIVHAYVRVGKVRIVLRTWAFIGPDSARGQAAVLAAGSQNRGFNALALFYDNQGTENTGWINDAMIVNVAASIPGLDVRRLLVDRSSKAVKEAAAAVAAIARERGITSTPTFLVGKTGAVGQPVDLKSPTDVQSLKRAIDRTLAQR